MEVAYEEELFYRQAHLARLPRRANQYADFYQRFEYSPEEGNAVLRIAADSNYCARNHNGEYVFAGQYADFPDMRFYDEIRRDGTPQKGENEMHVVGYCTLTDSSVYKWASRA
jgi:hypothetical protein